METYRIDNVQHSIEALSPFIKILAQQHPQLEMFHDTASVTEAISDNRIRTITKDGYRIGYVVEEHAIYYSLVK